MTPMGIRGQIPGTRTVAVVGITVVALLLLLVGSRCGSSDEPATSSEAAPTEAVAAQQGGSNDVGATPAANDGSGRTTDGDAEATNGVDNGNGSGDTEAPTTDDPDADDGIDSGANGGDTGPNGGDTGPTGSTTRSTASMVGTGDPSAPLSDPDETGRELAQRFLDILSGPNRSQALDEFLSPAFQLQRANGTFANRDEYLADPAVVGNFAILDDNFRALQDGPALTVRFSVDVQENAATSGTSASKAERLAVFLRSDSGWQLLAWSNFNTPSRES